MTLSVHVPADIVAIAKVRVADPTKVRQYERIVLGLAKEIKRAARAGEVTMFNAAAKKLEAEWSNLTKAQQDKVIREVGLIVRQHYVSMESKTATKLASFGRQIMKGTRKVFKDKIDPNISASLTSKDRVFVSRVSKSRAWFVKDHGKMIDEAYREKAADIISSGAEAGLSDKQVSKELKRVLNNKAIQQSEAYYRTVANAAMNRSRTWSSLQSYDEAGIRGYTYAATLDEVTTDQCFAEGTQILTPNGYTAIEKIRPTALVVTGSNQICQVAGVLVGTTDTWILIGMSNGRSVCATPNHPFFVIDASFVDGAWKDAETLQSGIWLFDSRTGDQVEVRSVQRFRSNPAPTYNLEIESEPTYIAEGVLVHNCRFLHGKEYIVRDGIALMEKTEQEALDNPEAVKDVTPWMTTVKDKKTGNKFLAFKRGTRTTRVAEIKRSAVGQRDRVGSYDQLRSDDQLKKDGFQFPPLHGN